MQEHDTPTEQQEQWQRALLTDQILNEIFGRRNCQKCVCVCDDENDSNHVLWSVRACVRACVARVCSLRLRVLYFILGQ